MLSMRGEALKFHDEKEMAVAKHKKQLAASIGSLRAKLKGMAQDWVSAAVLKARSKQTELPMLGCSPVLTRSPKWRPRLRSALGATRHRRPLRWTCGARVF